MSDPTPEQLLGHLLGALDDDEHQSLDARLEQDDDACRELAAWRRRLAPLEAMRPDFEPRPGLARRTCRLVAAYATSTVNSQLAAAKPRMSPHPMPPSRTTHVGWFDMAVGAVLLMAAVALVLPAIESSRFQARLASCQNGLRQFGLALTQYSNHQRSELTQLASRERLTSAGLAATSLIKNIYSADSRHAVCPDAWLATQGILGNTRHVETQLASIQLPATDSPDMLLGATDNRSQDWSGAWRNGTTDGWRSPPSPANMPLLADAPSADVPGQTLASHGGRGRNVLYADGRTDFLPLAASRDMTASTEISAPIIFVGGR